MADTKISDDPAVAANALVDTDSLPGLFGNANKRLTWANLKAALLTGLSVATITAKGLLPQLPNDASKFLDGTGNWSAPPSGGGSSTSVPRHPGYRSGVWYRQGRYGVGSNPVAANLVALPLVIDAAVTISAIKVRIGTGAAGTNIRVGIYNNVNGAPAGLVTGTDGVVATVTSATDAVLTFANSITLQAGIYWIGFLPDSTSASLLTCSTGDPQANAMVGANDGAVPNSSTSYAASTPPAYSAGMPTTFPAGTAGTTAVPVAWFRAA